MTICLTILGLAKLTELMEMKSSDYKYVDFFEQEEDFDVLFMGTSHVLNGVFPMELWNDHGIVSYNLGGHSNQMATTYWTLRNALDYTTPDVVVIDCLSCTGDWKCSDIFSFVHISLDAFPTTFTKISAIWDLLDDENLDKAIEQGNARISAEPRTKIGLLWNYSVYHSRWDEIGHGDFDPGMNDEKGAESRINVIRGSLERTDSSGTSEQGTVGELYLRRIIEDCKKQGIEVLLIYLPFPADEDSQLEAKYVYKIAEEYGVNYINFLDEDVINYQTDLYDENSHLNPSGARKITKYLGEYLEDFYNLENHKQDKQFSEWTDDYEQYCNLKNRNLVDQSNIINYLMLLSGDGLDIVMNVRNKDLYKNDWILDLLDNIGVDKGKISESTDFIVFVDGKSYVLNDFTFDGVKESVEGKSFQLLNDALYIDDNPMVNYIFSDNTSMQVTVFRNNDVIDDVKYVYEVDPDTTDVNVIECNR